MHYCQTIFQFMISNGEPGAFRPLKVGEELRVELLCVKRRWFAFLWRFSRYVQLVRNPRVDQEYAGDIIHLFLLWKTSMDGWMDRWTHNKVLCQPPLKYHPQIIPGLSQHFTIDPNMHTFSSVVWNVARKVLYICPCCILILVILSRLIMLVSA